MKMGKDVTFSLKNVRVLEHPQPLFLLGADILRGGRMHPEWNFSGLTQKTVAGGNVEGELRFERRGSEVACPLTFCPSMGNRRF